MLILHFSMIEEMEFHHNIDIWLSFPRQRTDKTWLSRFSNNVVSFVLTLPSSLHTEDLQICGPNSPTMAPQGHTATSETVDHLRVLCLVDL